MSKKHKSIKSAKKINVEITGKINYNDNIGLLKNKE